MNCEECKENLVSYHEGTLPDAERLNVETHLRDCEDCKIASEQTRLLLAAFEKSEPLEPGEKSRARFLERLEKEKQDSKTVSLHFSKSFMRYAAAVALLICGFFAGRLMSGPDKSADQIASLSAEVEQMRQLLMVSMLKDASASDRILAVSYSSEFNNPSDKTIETLVHTLDYDESPNVRMAAAKALRKFSGAKAVREALLDAFQYQTDPTVQITLIDILVELGEKNARPRFEELKNDTQINPTVRKQAEIGSALLL